MRNKKRLKRQPLATGFTLEGPLEPIGDCVPVADKAEITTTSIYPTIEAMWAESIASLPWFEKYSPETRRTIRFAFYTAAAETLRTVAFRMNAEQADTVFADFDRELRAYDLELQQAAADIERAGAELH